VTDPHAGTKSISNFLHSLSSSSVLFTGLGIQVVARRSFGPLGGYLEGSLGSSAGIITYSRQSLAGKRAR
jgi:hypothetical protein